MLVEGDEPAPPRRSVVHATSRWRAPPALLRRATRAGGRRASRARGGCAARAAALRSRAASGRARTALLALRRDRQHRLAHPHGAAVLGSPPTPRAASSLAAPVRRWIRLLVSTLPPAPVPTRASRISAPAMWIDRRPVPVARGQSGIAWIAPAQAARRGYLGVEPDGGDGRRSASGRSPDQAWVALRRRRRARLWTRASCSRPTAATLPSDDASTRSSSRSWRGGAPSSRSRASARDLASRRRRAARSSRESLRQLAAVGGGERLEPDAARATTSSARATPSPRWLEIGRRASSDPHGSGLFADAARALAADRRAHPRGAARGRTGTTTTGALLGFLVGEDESRLHPVALLPSSARLRRPRPARATRRERLDAEIAEQLHPQAYQFYAPLPDRPLRPLDVLRFSSASSRPRRRLRGARWAWRSARVGTFDPAPHGAGLRPHHPGRRATAFSCELTLVLFAVYPRAGALRPRARLRARARPDAHGRDARGRRSGIACSACRCRSSASTRRAISRRARRASAAIRDVLAGATLSAMLGGVFSVWNFALPVRRSTPGSRSPRRWLVLVAAVVAGIAAYYALQRQRAVADARRQDRRPAPAAPDRDRQAPRHRRREPRVRRLGAPLRATPRRGPRRRVRQRARRGVPVGVSRSCAASSCSGSWPRGQTRGSAPGSSSRSARRSACSSARSWASSSAGLHALVAIPLYERARPILTEPVESRGTTETRVELGGAIEVSHVSFRYDPSGPLILDDVSLQHRRGRVRRARRPVGLGQVHAAAHPARLRGAAPRAASSTTARRSRASTCASSGSRSASSCRTAA